MEELKRLVGTDSDVEIRARDWYSKPWAPRPEEVGRSDAGAIATWSLPENLRLFSC